MVSVAVTSGRGEGDPLPPRALLVLADVEYATVGWVDWYNHRRLHGTLGMMTPNEYEQDHYQALAREPQTHMRAAEKP